MADQADKNGRKPMTYAEAGVDIEAGDEMVSMIERDMRRTYGQRVLSRHGAFAGCFRLDYNEKLFKRNYRDPVLVSCTDGVGTKVKLASRLGKYDTVGQDLVAMSINDLLVQGAEPLFFLDYIGINKLDPDTGTAIVKGVADGCQQADCALLGGETAEMPDVYDAGDFDLAGFAVGVCELDRLITGERIEKGDIVLGLASSGIHSNGYSLVRRIVDEAGLDLDKPSEKLDDERTLGEVLLEPTRIYARAVVRVLRAYKVKQPVAGMAHITGGGLEGNLNRVLGDKLNARIDRDTIPTPPVFRLLQKAGGVEEAEMWRVFNMGVGYCLVVRPYFADAITARLEKAGETVLRMGEIVKGTGEVEWA
ncbi:MAG: phosphoribosylformylglycinamidine cyclo-ligase [Phycisphaeraceae bacterium]|nr:phosphoribosylformylglycinamidine cyclo-ligase [Phycisphaeraceae bacterium]